MAFALALVIAGAPAQAFDARGSAGQVYVTGLQPGAQTTLLDSGGRTVATKQADAQGGLLFRKVEPGGGYRVRRHGGQPSEPLTVLSATPAPASTDIYDQSIPNSGYGYLTTRDGTKLAINVHPPQDAAQALPGGHPAAAAAGSTSPTRR